MIKNCLNCLHFSYWDNDWCCLAHMIILSEINQNKTVNPDNCEKDRSNCKDWEDKAKTCSHLDNETRMKLWESFK